MVCMQNDPLDKIHSSLFVFFLLILKLIYSLYFYLGFLVLAGSQETQQSSNTPENTDNNHGNVDRPSTMETGSEVT